MNLPRGPKGHFIVGCLPELRRDILGFMAACAHEYGDIVPVRAAGQRIVIVSHPETIEQILVHRARFLTKSSLLKQRLSPLIGEGLLLSEGDFWLRQRRLIQPAFHRDCVAAYGKVAVDCAQLATADWQDGDTRDIHAAMMALTLGIVAKALFDIDLSDTTPNVGEALQEAIGRPSHRRNRMLGLAEWIPMLARTRSCKTLARLDQVVYELINRRRASAEDRNDLLSMLLRARDSNDGGPISDRQVRDEVVTLFLAGQETTALSLSCTWYLLAQHPEVQARLEAEFAMALGGRPPTVADLPRLPYTEMVVKETMRLYPPAYAVFRSVAEPFDIDGYQFEAETMLVMPQWVVQRDPRWFDDPEAFRPSRWEGDLAKRIPKYAYFPFGGGSRQCLGKTFAATEAALLLATIGQRFRFGTIAGESAAQLISRKQRGDHGLRMVLARR